MTTAWPRLPLLLVWALVALLNGTSHGTFDADGRDGRRSLLVDGVMSVDFAAVYQSSGTGYNAAGRTASAGTILLTIPATPRSVTNVTFFQAGNPSSNPNGFTQTGGPPAANNVINGNLSFVDGGGATVQFWCGITRDQLQVPPSNQVEAAYYCYDNTVAASASGYLLVIKSPPATMNYTARYDEGGEFDLNTVSVKELNKYRTDYIATFPTTAPSRRPTTVPSERPSTRPTTTPSSLPRSVVGWVGG